MRAALLTLGLGLTLAAPAAAHDFWIQPAAFRTEPGATTPITLQVGHGDQRRRTPIALRRILRFTDTAPGGAASDLRDALNLGASAEDGAVRLQPPGVHVLALETDAAAESHLPAAAFNAYLEAEGVTPAQDVRARDRRTDADGSENYRRCAKALVQVGSAFARAADLDRPVGLTLEIVAEANPYAARRSARLPVRVLFEGKPLAGALVKLTDLDHDATPIETRRSDATGRAVFAMPPAGRWQMNVIWTKPLPRARETDFETTFSSLSFG